MGQPIKRRPRTAPAVSEVYILNKREEESLCAKLDVMHYKHHVGLTRLRQDTDQIARQGQSLLTQRAVTPQSTLEHIMNEIQTFKQNKHCKRRPLGTLPASTEISVEVIDMYSKWPSSSFVPQDMNGRRQSFSVATPERTSLNRKLSATDHKDLEYSQKSMVWKKRPNSSLLQRSASGTDLLTYKELGGIARLESISIREAEKREKQKLLARQRLSNSLDSALRQRIDHFFMKLESR
ncbi:hypothetical protein XENTR_v10015038 [Xenopus tropicalis]|uniref:Uncharacterized protein LOC100495804 n=1 Tax=Xenopus tropicalis TaxID=8364 RepID=A0A8J0QQV6_XENTR|nr:uncharacterized protein LOC100495804 [Xenopus tropicalis]KAE8605231.1 hypothetical protein XENTR_v10015038 [Xenopus tropicalis]|eukprot:XP_002936024.1 PREDICTED: uncharacterized protein LOC100495804 [Xenopus tropicalis]